MREQKKWNSVSVNVAFACIVNADKDRVESVTEEHFKVNGESVNVHVGETHHIHGGGKIERYSQNSVKVYGSSGSYVDATFYHEENNHWPQPQFVNLIIQVHNPKEVKGMCVAEKFDKRSHGVFEHEYDPRFPVVARREFSEQEKAVATEKCKNAKVQEKHLKICRDDILYTGSSCHMSALLKLETKMKK